MTKRLNVGIIGLGEVAQIIHLPVLELHPEQFRIAALCDISPKLVQHMGGKYRVSRLYTDSFELVKQSDLDVVFVLNSDEYHAECVIAAADQKKHVLVEKPMCLTDAEADAIIAARERNGVKIMVGYMRRYAEAFTDAMREIGDAGLIQYARIRDIIGFNPLFVKPVGHVANFGDIPEERWADRKGRAERLVREAIGESPESPYAGLYRMLCGLSCHDLSAMREVLGMPKGVVGAKLSRNGYFYLNAIFDYDRFSVTFETGQDHQARFDAHIEVYAPSKSVRVQYDTNYIRSLPVTLHISQTEGDRYVESAARPTYRDPYSLQLQHLYEAIVNDSAPKTTPEDFKQDLAVFRMLIDAVRRTDASDAAV